MTRDDVGYRYVMGEREGFGNTNHTIDEFAGIGLHVHEIGHLLGLEHGSGTWVGNNPHKSPSQLDTTTGANFVGWGLMQGGREGPEQADTTRGLSRAYSSCPVPINPFYRMDLGWLDPTEITASQNDYPLALGSVYMIDTGTRIFPTDPRIAHDILLLERRSNNSFGRYISFYEYEDQDPGLLIWRRTHAERPVLIVADGRRIRNARDQEANFQVPEYQDQLSDPFPVSADVYPLYGESTSPSYAQPTVNAVYAHTADTGLRQEVHWDAEIGRNLDPGNLGVALTDIQRSNDTLTLDIQLNYWAGDIVSSSGGRAARVLEIWGDGVPSWDTGTVSVAGDVTIRGSAPSRASARLNIARGTEVHFLSDPEVTPYSDDHDTARSEIGGLWSGQRIGLTTSLPRPPAPTIAATPTACAGLYRIQGGCRSNIASNIRSRPSMTSARGLGRIAFRPREPSPDRGTTRPSIRWLWTTRM